MGNPNPKNQFVPGDARINRRGRKVGSFDKARKLAQQIANEPVPNKEDVTRLENLFREWSNPRHPKSDKFVEYAVGKVPNPVEVTGKDGEVLKVVVEYANGKTDAPSVPSEPTDNP